MTTRFIDIPGSEKLARQHNARLGLLLDVVSYAQNEQPIAHLINAGVGFDTAAYHDALLQLKGLLDKRMYFTQKPVEQMLGTSQISDFWGSVSLEQDTPDDVVLAHNNTLLMVLSLDAKSFNDIKRILGSHHISSLATLIGDKSVDLIVPFEYVAHIDYHKLPKLADVYRASDMPIPSGLPSTIVPEITRVSAASMFALEPFNKAFAHTLVPAPVAALVIDGDLSHVHGYVVHPNYLYHTLRQTFGELSQNKQFREMFGECTDDSGFKSALPYDATLALKLLKYRYGVPISDEQIGRTSQNDVKMYETFKEHGHVFLTY